MTSPVQKARTRKAAERSEEGAEERRNRYVAEALGSCCDSRGSDEARASVDNRAKLRLELDALGIDHYDRQALARIARIGALLIALGLESEPLDDAMESSPLVKNTLEELQSYESEQAELIVERDKLKEELEQLRDCEGRLIESLKSLLPMAKELVSRVNETNEVHEDGVYAIEGAESLLEELL